MEITFINLEKMLPIMRGVIKVGKTNCGDKDHN